MLHEPRQLAFNAFWALETTTIDERRLERLKRQDNGHVVLACHIDSGTSASVMAADTKQTLTH